MVVVYGLIHIASGRIYVGCTAGKLSKRFREHRCLLNNGKHNEKVLQREWKLYGSEAFLIKELEMLPKEAAVAQKREAELRWMAKFEEEGLLYNTNKHSFQLSKEATVKGIEASRIAGRWRNGVPEDHGAKISAGKKAHKLLRLKEIV